MSEHGELKPCPFCSGSSHLEANSAVRGGKILVHDGEPGCPMRGHYVHPDAWNTRHSDDRDRVLEEAAKPRRAHVFKIEVGANTLEDLTHELRHYAGELERGKISEGCSGSPSAGSIYSYSHDPAWTKERYFEALDRALKGNSQ